jgi:hypothetical protein
MELLLEIRLAYEIKFTRVLKGCAVGRASVLIFVRAVGRSILD